MQYISLRDNAQKKTRERLKRHPDAVPVRLGQCFGHNAVLCHEAATGWWGWFRLDQVNVIWPTETPGNPQQPN